MLPPDSLPLVEKLNPVPVVLAIVSAAFALIEPLLPNEMVFALKVPDVAKLIVPFTTAALPDPVTSLYVRLEVVTLAVTPLGRIKLEKLPPRVLPVAIVKLPAVALPFASNISGCVPVLFF